MAPAFRSLRQAVAFALLLLGLLALPAILGPSGLVPRSSLYESMTMSAGPFPYLGQECCEEKSDADIIFIGGSTMLYGIDTPYVRRQLSAKLGREAKVMSIGSFYCAEDRNYFLLRDFLRHRKVKMVVLGMEEDDLVLRYGPGPYICTYRFFQEGQDSPDIAGLSSYWKAAFYANAVLGGPRLLLAAILPPLRINPVPYADTLGMMPVRFEPDQRAEDLALAPFHPAPPKLPVETMIYAGTNKSSFQFAKTRMSDYQLYFLRRMADLVREHGIHLVILDFPPSYHASQIKTASLLHPTMPKPEIQSPEVEMFCYWPDALGIPVDLVGVPKAKLFAGLSPADVGKFYSDRVHLNPNGRLYFTPVITPAILKLYDQQNIPR